MPLQRARVLEFIDQEVGDARVEPLLDPARQLAVAQQAERDALEVGHVGKALSSLVVGERREQRAAETNHAQMLLARFVLVDLIAQGLQLGLRVLDERQAPGQRARLGRLVRREEDRSDGVVARAGREGERGCELFRCISRELAARRRELARGGAQQLRPRRDGDRFGGMSVGGQLRPDVLGPLDARREHARLVGELELDAPVPDRVEPDAHLMPAARRRGRGVVGPQGLVAQQHGVKGAVHGRLVLAPILDQLGVGMNAEPVEQRERRRAQQLREPAVEGADLDRSSGCQHAALQRAELGRERLGAGRVDAALEKRAHALLVGRARRREVG